MIRLLIAVVLTFAGATFAMANTHHVPLSLLVAEPVEIRLIFLLMTTFLAGVLFASFSVLIRSANRRRRLRTIKKEMRVAVVEPSTPDLVDGSVEA